MDFRGAEAARGARRVDGDVAAADDEDLRPARSTFLPQLDVGEEGEGALTPSVLLAGHVELNGLVRARRDEDGVEAVVLERRDVVDSDVRLDLDADRRDVADVVVYRRRSGACGRGCRGGASRPPAARPRRP